MTPGPVELVARRDGGRTWPALVWRAGPGWRMISSGVQGGGLGERCWWLNTQVERTYGRLDPQRHLLEIAAELGLHGPGVGLLTAADVRFRQEALDGGVRAVATVGLGLPVPAAAPDDVIAAEAPPGPAPRDPLVTPAVVPGTINVLVVLPVPLTDAALVNAVITVTEAKTQALAEAGVPGTGTSSDAVCIACPVPRPDGPAAPEPFGGPRSPMGARAARAVHRAITAGTAEWLRRNPDGDTHRPWRLVGR